MHFVAALGLLLMQAEQQPSNAAEWKRLGLSLLAEKKLPAAVDPLTKACDLDPRDEEACYYLARILNALSRWDEARTPFERALRAAPKPMLARVHRAIALNFMALGHSAEAEQHFRQAIAASSKAESLPDDPRVDYGAFLFRQGRTDEALEILQQAVSAAPKSARAHGELGRVLLHSGKPNAAVVRLEKAVELDPRASSFRLLLGRAYLQTGRTEDGQKQLKMAQAELQQ